MSITRRTWTDDDGSGTTGTIVNNSELQALYDDIDALVGDWTDVTFNAGDFTASGSMTWTVESGDVVTLAYVIIGKLMFVSFVVSGTTVGGTLSTQLRIAIPAGKTATKEMYGSVKISDNSTRVEGRVFVSASGTTIKIERADGGNFSAATNTTGILGQIFFRIN